MTEQTEHHTFVFSGGISETENPFNTQYCGMKSVAWARGNALEVKDKLEDFIHKLAGGDIQDPETSAQELMDELGWG